MVDLVSTLSGHASATALIEGDRRVSYAELDELALRTAAGLRARGLTSGARVAVAADATIDGVVAYLGVQAAGLVPVMVSSRSPRPELDLRFDEVDPALVLLGTAREVDVPGGIAVLRPAGADDDDVPSADAPAGAAVVPGADDPAVVLYTSGVSGYPRPVVLTHRNLAATSDGLIRQPNSRIDSATVALCAVPLAHVFGLNSILGTVLRAGGEVVLTPDTDPLLAGELVARHRVTMLSTVPVLWKALTTVDDPTLFSTVTRPTYSAAPMPPSVLGDVEAALGLVVVGGFGMTETAGTICHDDVASPTLGSLGRALGSTEVRIVDDDGGDILPGDFGELLLRGPSITRHYLDGSPAEVDDEGWMRTGDLATFDDLGAMSIVDRRKDVINIGGFNVSPIEVETALDQHPAVVRSVVVGDVEGNREIVVAHVLLTAEGAASVEQLTDHCRDLLSRYKVPERIHVHDELPVTASGKAVRRLLTADG